MRQRFRTWIRSALEFSSSETGAFMVLLPLLLVVMTSGRIYRKIFPEQPPAFLLEISPDSVFAVKERSLPLFPFDPNTAADSTLVRLGIDQRVAERIIRYRNKGGRFRQAKDLSVMYGIDPVQFRRLEPWIRIKDQRRVDTAAYQRRPARPVRVVQYDLNRADTADFESVSGIGRKTAARIIRYRSALGGFIRREQLYEVFGIDSLAVFSMDRFTVADGFTPAPLVLNAAAYEELEAHPYLSPMQARAILMYRFQHGRIAGEQELMKVRLMDARTMERIRPYVDYR